MTTSQKLQRLHSTTFCVLYFADFQRGEINDFLNVKVNRTLIIHNKQFHVVPPSLKHRRQPQLNYSTAGPRINDKAIFGTECRTNTLMYIGKADAVFHPVHTAFPAIAYSLQIHTSSMPRPLSFPSRISVLSHTLMSIAISILPDVMAAA